jgi:hypothetical protein
LKFKLVLNSNIFVNSKGPEILKRNFFSPNRCWAETQKPAHLFSFYSPPLAQPNPTIHSPARGQLANCFDPIFFFVHAAWQGVSSAHTTTHLGPAAGHAAHRTGVIFLLDTKPKQRRREEILPQYES